jgi:hypothetical protein
VQCFDWFVPGVFGGPGLAGVCDLGFMAPGLVAGATVLDLVVPGFVVDTEVEVLSHFLTLFTVGFVVMDVDVDVDVVVDSVEWFCFSANADCTGVAARIISAPTMTFFKLLVTVIFLFSSHAFLKKYRCDY